MQNKNIALGVLAFQKAQQAHAEKRYEDAAKYFNKALALMPDNPKVLLEFARLATEIKDWVSAETLYRRIGELRPNSNFEPFLAEALYRQEKYEACIPYFRTALSRNPDHPDIMHALAFSLCSLGQWEEGCAFARNAEQLSPTAKYMDALLNALFHLGRADELDELAPRALALYPDSPDVRSMYCLHRLSRGDFREGFRYFADFRWRNNRNVPPDGGTPGEWWDGTPFDGTLLVTAEQGLGDELMASSMYEDLVRIGQRTLIECDPRLIPVYRRSFPPLLEFAPRGQRALKAAFEAGGNFRKTNTLDLAGFFRVDRDAFPGRKAWLKPDPAKVEELRARYTTQWPGTRLVGFSWKSARTMEGRAEKGTRLTDFIPLLTVPGNTFLSLQYGDTTRDLAELRAAGCEALQVDPQVDATQDIDSLFAQVAALDCVVSTSNTTVHIAGSLSIPCDVLLPKVRPILWYWGYAGETTPWYPSLCLLRNPREDNWDEQIARAARRLAEKGNPAR